MKDEIVVDLSVVRNIIDELRSRSVAEAHSSEIIRRYMGGFYSNQNVPAHLSWNAQFGRILKRHSDFLGISEVKADDPVLDDIKHRTSSSLWKL